MILSGAVGGFSNWLVNSRNSNNIRLGWLGYCILGSISAMVVPLFLSIAQSEILQGLDTFFTSISLFKFIGFCIIAGYSADNFMNSIVSKLIEQVKNVKEDLSETKELVDEVRDTTLPDKYIIQDKTTDESTDEVVSFEKIEGLSTSEIDALKSAAMLTKRTATGIREDAKISKEKFPEILDKLCMLQLLERTSSDKTNGLRYKITNKGINFLNSLANTPPQPY